ncbi:MAG: DUF4399 domain-containing protein [Pseudomonadota bacterium]
MYPRFFATATALGCVMFGPAIATQQPAPAGAGVYIISPEDGATVQSPVTVVFGLKGMGIAPAGIHQDGTGHHHLLINIDPATIPMAEPLAATDNIVHFGGGQTETSIDLPAGEHTLYLLLGDGDHIPFDPPILSEPVQITVQ